MGILFGELAVHFTELDILHEASPEHKPTGNGDRERPRRKRLKRIMYLDSPAIPVRWCHAGPYCG
jgi:hypothetical protein